VNFSASYEDMLRGGHVFLKTKDYPSSGTQGSDSPTEG
jgi:hypothetical protein